MDKWIVKKKKGKLNSEIQPVSRHMSKNGIQLSVDFLGDILYV